MGNDLVGGFAGAQSGGNIINTYSAGLVSGTSNAGGFMGQQTGGSVVSSYWDSDVAGQTGSAAGTAKSTWEMIHQSTFAGWDFSTVWTINTIPPSTFYTYPYFQWQLIPPYSPSQSNPVKPSISNAYWLLELSQVQYEPGTECQGLSALNADCLGIHIIENQQFLDFLCSLPEFKNSIYCPR